MERQKEGVWRICFEMSESQKAFTPKEDICRFQREVTRAIGKTLSMLPARFEELQIVDYEISRNSKEQPEAACLELTKHHEN